MKRTISAFFVFALALSLLSCVRTAQADTQQTVKPHYELARLTTPRKQQVIEHLGYTVSYSPVWHVPHWVAYSLTRSETMGEVPRAKSFTPDPKACGAKVTHQDYTKSGYDRGHMAPAGDMKWSERAMAESFYTTNICPQNHNLNNGDWKALEELARDWAAKYGEVFIACGPIVEADYKTIGCDHRIAVPKAFYKVALRRKGKSWTAIGFIFPNAAGSRPLMTYMLSVDEVEQRTGIDFFYLLPDSIENKVEADYNIADWTI